MANYQDSISLQDVMNGINDMKQQFGGVRTQINMVEAKTKSIEDFCISNQSETSEISNKIKLYSEQVDKNLDEMSNHIESLAKRVELAESRAQKVEHTGMTDANQMEDYVEKLAELDSKIETLRNESVKNSNATKRVA